MTLALLGNVKLYLIAAGVLLGLLTFALLLKSPAHGSTGSLGKSAATVLLKPTGVLWH